MQKRIVFSLGGSLLYKDKTLDVNYIKRFSKFVSKLSKRFAIVVVVGGGTLAREFISVARKFTKNNFLLDIIGIEATRMNAMLLSISIPNAEYIENPLTLEELSNGKIFVTAGLIPGISTDGVAALIAEKLGATFVNLTNVDGLYTADPNKFKNVEIVPKIKAKKLREFLQPSFEPGQHFIIDNFALNIIERSSIRCIIVNGRKFSEILKALTNKRFRGTIVE
ncbi:MAG: UMP kinase [Candidatus Diapherotrites archaeon]|nr:UMP kinase [Candidatus Diapherotrites archaeon]